MLRTDREVLDDIDRHFEQIERYEPKADDYRGIDEEIVHEVPHNRRSIGVLKRRQHQPSVRRPYREETSRRHRAHSKSRRGRTRTSQSAEEGTRHLSGIREVAKGTFVIDSSLMDAAQKDPRRFTGNARTVIAERRGEPAGFKLGGIQRSDVLYAIGLRNGDIVTAVNGHELKSIDEVLVAVTALRFSKQYRVDILRNNKPRSFYYRVE